MPWNAPEPAHRCAVARGVRAQWQLQYRALVEPGLLALLGRHDGWLVTLLHARTHAAGSPRALGIFLAFERELAKITGHVPIAWPKTFDLCPHPYTIGRLPQLQPQQLLVATAGLRAADDATRSLVALLLDRAFGGELPRGSLRGEARVEVLGLALTEPFAAGWLGAETPASIGRDTPGSVIAGMELASARRLLRAAFGPEGATDAVFAVDESDVLLDPTEALDLICAALVLRACLRAAGDLPVSSPDWSVAPAANDGRGYLGLRAYGRRRRKSA